MSLFKRLLGAEDGWGGAAGTLLLVGFGVFVLFVSMADLREAARVKPEERTCDAWLADPSGARWVSLTGCQLDLGSAASRKWKGWRAQDGGVSADKMLELFIPIADSRGAWVDPPRAVLATSNPELLALLDGIEAIPPEDVGAYLTAHDGAFQSLLKPTALSGYVEPVKSLAARTALGVLTAEDAVVLEQGRAPPRANALFGVLVGLLCVGIGMRSIGRRYLVIRDTST